MSRAIAASPMQKRIIPAFTVEKLDGEYSVNVAKKTKSGLEYSEEKRPRGWLVKFPKGHSIHVATFEEMRRMGFDQTEVPLVDEDGEVVGTVPNVKVTKKEKTDA